MEMSWVVRACCTVLPRIPADLPRLANWTIAGIYGNNCNRLSKAFVRESFCKRGTVRRKASRLRCKNNHIASHPTLQSHQANLNLVRQCKSNCMKLGQLPRLTLQPIQWCKFQHTFQTYQHSLHIIVYLSQLTCQIHSTIK